MTQVLISYALIPEEHYYYLADLEGAELEIALASQNKYGNADEWPQEEALQSLLEHLKRINVTDEPFEITGDVTVIHTGFFM